MILLRHSFRRLDRNKSGDRKPDPRFFQLALDRLGVKAEETVFLDDIGHNLQAAAKMGIKTIRTSRAYLQPAPMR